MDQFFEALEKSKNNVVLNVIGQVQYDETADVLEKGKRAQMGEIREWNGLKYQKTSNGWIPVKQQKEGASEKKEETGSKKDTHGVEKKEGLQYKPDTQKALEFVESKLSPLTEVEPADDGKTIKLCNIGYKEYAELRKKLTEAGFILRDKFVDYFPGDDEKSPEGYLCIDGYKPKKK